MARRVRRPKDKEKLFNTLTESDTAVFETYKDIFMMAACIGFHLGKREPFEQSSEPIAWTVFNGQTDLPIINAIALCETKDVTILLDDENNFDRKLAIIEEYANAGLTLLKERIIDSPGNAADNLMAFIYEAKELNKSDDIGLEQFEGTLFD